MPAPWEPIPDEDPTTLTGAVRRTLRFFDQRVLEPGSAKDTGLSLISFVEAAPVALRGKVQVHRAMSVLGTNAWRTLVDRSGLSKSQVADLLQVELVDRYRSGALQTVLDGGLLVLLSTMAAQLEQLPKGGQAERDIWINVAVLAVFYQIIDRGMLGLP